MTTRSLGPCLVCDAPAVGINFAVPTCAPCKAFFRRNAVKLGVSFLLHERRIRALQFSLSRDEITSVNKMVIVPLRINHVDFAIVAD